VGPRAGLETETTGKILSPGIEPRSSGRPARSQTLYCLSYPAHFLSICTAKYCRCSIPERLFVPEFHTGLLFTHTYRYDGAGVAQAV
jgi:hypothetical protein